MERQRYLCGSRAEVFAFLKLVVLSIDMSSGDVSEQCRRFCVLSWEQVQRLDSILGETVPVHGRGNFPTLSVQPRQIVQVIMKAHLSEYFSAHYYILNNCVKHFLITGLYSLKFLLLFFVFH